VKKKTYLHLTGGLGNQLFQLASGLFFCGSQELIVCEKNGKPRISINGSPEILSFVLPSKVRTLEQPGFSWIVSKTCGFIIRMGVNPRKIERIRILQSVIRMSASMVISLHLKKIVKVMKVNGAGYNGIRNKSNFLIGYFQTYKYAESPEVFESLQLLRLKDPSQAIQNLFVEAQEQKPIVVHLRRGDYAQESNFGLLGSQYYFDAISELSVLGEYKSIWVFSDDISEAKQMFVDGLSLPVRFFGDIEGSAAVTLEVMRHGHGFVIGNSSFSWWAAFLSHRNGARVIAPTPWFVDQEEPEFLIPQRWTRLNGHHFLSAPVQLESE
jgi:hypothetical protein